MISTDTDSKICPFCAETIKAQAVVCRYCGRDLEKPTDTISRTWNPDQPRAKADLEVALLEDARVKVTRSVAVIDGKVFSIANITSVAEKDASSKRRHTKTAGLVVGILLGLVAIYAVANYGLSLTSLFAVGLLAIWVGFIGKRLAHPAFALILITAASEVQALESNASDYIHRVASAIRDAISARG